MMKKTNREALMTFLNRNQKIDANNMETPVYTRKRITASLMRIGFRFCTNV
jgi:hypothetical protein